MLLCVPEDMPEPNSWAYQDALEQAVTEVAVAANGRTMALFTSHASLRATASAIRERLSTRGIGVLAQGVDGSPQQLVRRFLENPETVLLGTASFWEGVDLAGESLQALLVARLPFNVPTEPVFEARSEQFENAFMQYAVPHAILRLRQGFRQAHSHQNRQGHCGYPGQPPGVTAVREAVRGLASARHAQARAPVQSRRRGRALAGQVNSCSSPSPAPLT